MGWNSVVGQHTAKRLLQQAALRRRLPHALLLCGEDGAGSLAVALSLARAVTCESPNLEGGYDACGACRSCRQNASLQHPNVSVVTALPPGKADLESDLAQDVVDELAHSLRSIAEDPYIPLVLTGAKQIRIGQIRELKKQLSMSAMQQGHRVVIIHHTDLLTTEAANAFLKTLEEPHENVLLLLTTEAPDRILPTITSRCQSLTIPPIDEDDIVTALVASGTDVQDALLVAPLANGNLTQARNYLRDDIQADRADAVALLRSALRGRDFRIPLVEAVTNAADQRDRTRATLMLHLLATWFRDVQSVVVFGKDAVLSHRDQAEAVERFANSFGMADHSAALDIVDRGVRDIRQNVSVHSTLLSTMLELRSHYFQSIPKRS